MELFKIFGTLGLKGVDETNNQLQDVTGTAKSASNGMVSAFKKVGGAVVAAFTADKIISFGKDIVNTAATVEAETAAFAQIMGDYSEQASEKLNSVADSTGVMATRMQPYFTSLSAKFKGLGFDVEEATDYAARGLELAADAAAFWDKSLDDSMSHLNSFVNGSYEGGEAIGLFANETQMAMYAVEQGIVKTKNDWQNLDEATKQATRLEYAENMFALSGATGQAARESEQYANVQANLSEKWRQFKAEIGEPLIENVVIPAMQELSELIDTLSTGFQNFSTWVKENQTAVELIAIAIGTFAAALIAYNVAQNIANITMTIATAATTAFGTAVAFLTSPITLIVLAIGALIAIVVLLVKNWDKVKETAQEVWSNIQEIWGKVGEWFKSNVIDPLVNFFTELWNDISTGVQDAWQSICDAFSSVGEWVNTNVVQPVVGFFTELWKSIQEIWDTICNVVQVGIMLIGEIISAAFQIITLPWRFIWENTKEYVFAGWEAIKEIVSTAIDVVSDAISTAWETIKSVTSTVWEAIKNVFTTVWNAIVAFVTPIIETIKNAISTAWEAIKSVTSTVWEAIKDFFVTIWNAIVEFLTPIIETIKNAITTAWETIKSTVSSVMSAIHSVISSIWNAIKSIVANVMNSIKTTVSNVWDAVKTKVSNVIDGVKNTISEGLNKSKTTVSNVLDAIKEKFNSIFEKAKNIVHNAIETIKGYFNFTWSLPHIKLPHFSISGSFSLDPPSVPSFSVSWYKKAMENPMWLDHPTIFGMNPSGKLLGGGEAGDEVVAGAAKLKSMISDGVREETDNLSYRIDRLVDMIAEYMPEVIKNMKRELVLDSGTLVGQLAPAMDGRLGDINELRKRGN